MAVIWEDQAIGPAEITSDLQTMDESMDMEDNVHMEDEAGPSTISTPVSPTPMVHQPLLLPVTQLPNPLSSALLPSIVHQPALLQWHSLANLLLLLVPQLVSSLQVVRLGCQPLQYPLQCHLHQWFTNLLLLLVTQLPNPSSSAPLLLIVHQPALLQQHLLANLLLLLVPQLVNSLQVVRSGCRPLQYPLQCHLHQPPTPPSCSTPEPSKLSTITINSTSASHTLMTLVGHQSSTPPSPSTHELSVHCQIGLSTTPVSTLVSPTPTVYQPPPPSCSTPEPSELSAITINNKSVLHPMPPSSSQTIESTKSLEMASECQGCEESQIFDNEAW